MKWEQRARVISSLCKEIKNGKMKYDHKFQRRTDIWKVTQKSLLIDSIIRGIPIDPIKRTKSNNITKIIDGIQRMSTIYSFINDEFSLSNDCNPVEIDGVTYEIAGKKFKDLDPDVQDKITQLEITVITFHDCSDSEERTMFQRWNNGTPLNGAHLRNSMESDDVINAIYELISMPFFEKVMTKAMLKNDVDKDAIRQTFMLISLKSDDSCNFTKKSMNNFISNYRSDSEITSTIKKVLVLLDDAFVDRKKVKIARTSLPFILFSGYKVIHEGRDTTDYINKVKNFLETYDDNAEYKKYLVGGTTNTENVMGRLNYFYNFINSIDFINDSVSDVTNSETDNTSDVSNTSEF